MSSANKRLRKVLDHLRASDSRKTETVSVKAETSSALPLAPSGTYRFDPDQAGVRTRIATNKRIARGASVATIPLPRSYLQRLPDRTHVRPAALPGPYDGMSGLDATVLAMRAGFEGTSHELQRAWQAEFCPGGRHACNFVIPFVNSLGDGNFEIANLIMVCDPSDSVRLAQDHLRKIPNYQLNGFFHSLMSTDDREYWFEQRDRLHTAFLPTEALAKVLPVSVRRAEKCAARLWNLSNQGTQPVDMSDFFLHETMAQLQLALMGMDEEFMEQTNAKLRDSFAGRKVEPTFLRDFLVDLVDKMASEKFTTALDAEVKGCPVLGPLSAAISQERDFSTKFGNCLLFTFAGHDTTGNTLTFLLMELARRPHFQRRLQAEVDAFWTRHPGPLEYRDLKELPFMTRCVMETLRLWTAVPNGTFRELEYDDYCAGPAGEQVHLPKGTYVQIPNWPRQWSPELWGDDVMDWNPDRAFQPEEIWNGEGLSARNPSTMRFSPFTYQPRDCLGRNFAHMEMRTILLHVLRRYTFTLVPYDPARGPLRGLNRGGTLGPRDVWNPKIKLPDGSKDDAVALMCHLVPRE